MECVICNVSLFVNNCCSTLCGHVFHKDCVTKWISIHDNCPICRTHVDVRNVIRIYLPEPSGRQVSEEDLKAVQRSYKAGIAAIRESCKVEVELLSAKIKKLEKDKEGLKNRYSIAKLRFDKLRRKTKIESERKHKN